MSSSLSCSRSPLFSSSGLPCSPAEVYLRLHCPLPTPSIARFSSLLGQREERRHKWRKEGHSNQSSLVDNAQEKVEETQEHMVYPSRTTTTGGEGENGSRRERNNSSRRCTTGIHEGGRQEVEVHKGGIEGRREPTNRNRSDSFVGDPAQEEVKRIHYGSWCVIREDMIPYDIGSFVFIGDGVVLRPPPFLAVTRSGGVMLSSPLSGPPPPSRGTTTTGLGSTMNGAAAAASPLWSASIPIGSYTFIGPRVVCEASKIDSYVFIGEEAVIGPLVEIMEGACVTAGSVVPGEAVLAPFTVYEGRPAVPRGTIHATAHRDLQKELLRRLLEE